MWDLDHKEGWAPKNWYVSTVMLERTLESPLDSKKIIPMDPKGNQPWIFTGRTYAETLVGILLWGDISFSSHWKGRKYTMKTLDSILKSRDITLPTKVHIVKAMVFLVVMCGHESWTIQKVEPEELMLLNYGDGEDSWESLGLQADQTSQS